MITNVRAFQTHDNQGKKMQNKPVKINLILPFYILYMCKVNVKHHIQSNIKLVVMVIHVLHWKQAKLFSKNESFLIQPSIYIHTLISLFTTSKFTQTTNLMQSLCRNECAFLDDHLSLQISYTQVSHNQSSLLYFVKV